MSFEPPSMGSTVAVFHISSSECKYTQEFACVDIKYTRCIVDKDAAKEAIIRAHQPKQHISPSNDDSGQPLSPETTVHHCSSAKYSKEPPYVTRDTNGRITVDCPCRTMIVKTAICGYKCHKPHPTKWDAGVWMEKLGWVNPKNVSRLRAVCEAVPLPTKHQSKAGKVLDKVLRKKPTPADQVRNCSEWAVEVISAMWEEAILVPLRAGEGDEPIRIG
ncbi:uncharacterized protein DNG_02159 [Cephalotrichum gorgonifer]|uniref:Uncharacterized protein n=1 Tax=Cephalotrichum gorgonifer TaxID=2041049 RepID=A0AAE8MSU7_9PEZI|nr:uncharacterized protein DNG_02159 [Cephalotrichum gorgonifer]